MADFGAKLCSEPDCRQHDFLPFTCAACGLVFCQAHMAIGSGHRCSRGEEYLASVSVLMMDDSNGQNCCAPNLSAK